MVSPRVERIRGRKGVALRKARLQAEPLCRICRAKDRVTLATVSDHIKPLALGGTDTDDNVQCLCKDCHDAKTAQEQGESYSSGFAVNTHPEWFKPSAIPIEIICGPPSAGKTTHVSANAAPNDIVIDLDQISARLDPSFKPWQLRQGDSLGAAIRERNSIIGTLAKAKVGKAWLIVSAPTKAERDWWQSKLGGKVTLLNPGYSTCITRCRARGTAAAIEGVADWYRRAGEPWGKAKKAVTTGADGWPV